ncbi:hypothetical protein [Cyanobium sp. CH-040]|uniref:hypothetical protein n=1 Tax=Cyanobium sp. CH-040 TaxID=2823708 RepID=UPI0020CC5698|nr:hypothetical protein [Cyanobium sp. CH-040]MCP9928560.1 hypothetical protein [Cyanobium sp. CH-040]
MRAGSEPRRRLSGAAPLQGLILALLLLVLLLPAGCTRSSQAGASKAAGAPSSARPAGRLQEVAPPPAVQQLAAVLSEHRPRVTIAAPRDGSLLPPGEWILEITGSDWPLADAGGLGLGAHIAVQVDEAAPVRLTKAQPDSDGFRLSVPMAELAPGSHRITVYAARPWGETVKRPGASAQIRVHRAAINPLGLPAAGSAQLIAASPAELSTAEPVLLDWLLRDAPLQGLREGDRRWRVRVTINGDSVLIDQNTPLWLKGWRSGSNSVLLELVDERGDPINPPFNSLVREVNLGGGGPRPRWLGGPLSETELAALLGEVQRAPPAGPAAESAAAPADPSGDAADGGIEAAGPPPAAASADGPVQAGEETGDPEAGVEPPLDGAASSDLAVSAQPGGPAAEPEAPEAPLRADQPDPAAEAGTGAASPQTQEPPEA